MIEWTFRSAAIDAGEVTFRVKNERFRVMATELLRCGHRPADWYLHANYVRPDSFQKKTTISIAASTMTANTPVEQLVGQFLYFFLTF